MKKLFLYLLFLSSSTLFLGQEDKELYIEDETTEEEKEMSRQKFKNKKQTTSFQEMLCSNFSVSILAVRFHLASTICLLTLRMVALGYTSVRGSSEGPAAKFAIWVE